MNKTELKQNITKIKKLLKQRDYDVIDTGIELARALDEPAVFETLLEGCSIDKEGKLTRDKIFNGTGPAQPYLDYALVNLIGYAPKDTKLDKSLEHSKVKRLDLSENKENYWDSPILTGVWPVLPPGLTNLTNLISLDLGSCSSLQNVGGLVSLTNLIRLDLGDCSSLQNVGGLVSLTNLTELNLSSCDSLQNVDGLSNLPNLTSLDLGFCESLQNVDGLANLPKLTSLDLRYCDSLLVASRKLEISIREEVAEYQKNIRVFIALRDDDVGKLSADKDITSLDLQSCDLLQNVTGLATLEKLSDLNLSKCPNIKPKPSSVHMITRSQVAAYQIKIMKKAGIKIPKSFFISSPRVDKEIKQQIIKINKLLRSDNYEAGIELLKSLDDSEISKGTAKAVTTVIKKFLKQRDYDAIDTGIELARGLDEPAVFEALLGGCAIDEEGKLIRNKIFTGTGTWFALSKVGPAQPFLDYALWNLIGYAPDNTKIDKSLKCANIKRLDLSQVPLSQTELPFGIRRLKHLTSLDLSDWINLKNLDSLGNFANLTELRLCGCKSIQSLDGLVKLTNLRVLVFWSLSRDSANRSVQDLNGLANCIKLEYVNIEKCFGLKNVDGLANLPNLSSLTLSDCYEIHPKPSKNEMAAFEEVAAYQQEIKKSMK